jgi:predicted Rossmann fold nucleotide-binding protein DprA/Smf involved in DNA uptake
MVSPESDRAGRDRRSLQRFPQSEHGLPIGGLAVGIDSASHRGAPGVGKTIAVLGSESTTSARARSARSHRERTALRIPPGVAPQVHFHNAIAS